ncbi:hypothetical protein HUG10_07295 [Halorarum halophilum]|uniref:Uncharacterized protein n=1 Tax=Halorarum halophilum TaxID=2743090 RepID=A0A7D5L2Q2_9EURY|nr:hypothetical protein [Halobaculum halophilum]QLG27363.1 hypothetical protein HUG10_07295 [Halobaculum halophilum]
MMMTARRAMVVVLCALLIVSGTVPLIASGDSQYEITVDTEIDTPERTITIEGQSYTVASMGKAPTEGELTFDVDTPGVDRYSVHLYNSDRQIVESTRETEDGTVSFDTSGYTSGSYVLVVSVNGVQQVIQPVVITDYEIDVDAPTDVTAGSSFTLEAMLSGSSTTPEHVAVTLSNGTWDTQFTASEDGGAYVADIPGTLAAGEYSMYVTTHSDNEFNGQKEVTGLSSVSIITVNADESDTSSGGGDAGNGAEETPDETVTDSAATNESPTVTTTTSSPDTSDATPAEPTDKTTTTEPNAIQPADTETTTTETTAPGFPILGFALLGLAGAWMQLRAGRRE